VNGLNWVELCGVTSVGYNALDLSARKIALTGFDTLVFMHDQITLDRVLPFWHESIAPEIQQGKRIIIAAHGETHCCCVCCYDCVWAVVSCVVLNAASGKIAVAHIATQLLYLCCIAIPIQCGMQ
jgi:hypothetical protein